MKFKVTYFEIKKGKAGPTVEKLFTTRPKIKQFLKSKAYTIADYVVFDLQLNKTITQEFKNERQ